MPDAEEVATETQKLAKMLLAKIKGEWPHGYSPEDYVIVYEALRETEARVWEEAAELHRPLCVICRVLEGREKGCGQYLEFLRKAQEVKEG